MRPMSWDIFKKLIDNAAELRIPELCPNGYGEFMTLRNVENYLDYISSRKHQFRVILNTNGFRMADDKIRLLMEHRVHLVNICIDGATAETAEKIRVGLKLAQIEANILRLMELRHEYRIDYPKVRVGFVVIPQNAGEISAFLDKWRGKVDYVGADGYANRAGSLTGRFGDRPVEGRTGTCSLPFHDLNIWSDGKAVLCCNDWNEQAVVGDLNTQTIREIWWGAALREARRLHRAGHGGDLKICASCNYWRQPSLGATLWE